MHLIKKKRQKNFVIDTPTKSTEKVVAKDTGDIFKFEADVEFTEGTRTFGVRFYEDEDKAESYQFVFNVTEDRYVFEKNQTGHGLQTRISDWRDRWSWYLVKSTILK